MAVLLGVYFGPKLISVSGTKGRRITHYIKIPRSAILEDGSEEKVPEELKLVAVFNEELRRNRVDAKVATLSLSGKDLIIRTFELPPLPAAELPSAVNFEAKKYTPFKIEELVSDFQVTLDKATRKNLVLFIGIKKETLDKYISLFKQLNLKLNYIDYSAFSVLRCLRLAGLGVRGIIGLVNLDLDEEEEANFTVIENGFPLFSRDITLPGETEEVLEKLKTELRISLDYYQRKFPLKKLRDILFVADKDYHLDSESLARELDLPVKQVSLSKIIGKAQAFSLSLVKAYGSTAYRTAAAGLKVNLLLPKAKVSKKVSVGPEKRISVLAGLKIDFKIIALGLFILGGIYVSGLYHTSPLRTELEGLIASRPKLKSITKDATLEELKKIDAEYRQKIKNMDALIAKQVYLTEPLEAISRSIPEDMWLTNLSFQKDAQNLAELTLIGYVSLEKSEKELALVSSFVSQLKENSSFNKYFNEIKIVSVEQKQLGQIMVTGFTISCKH